MKTIVPGTAKMFLFLLLSFEYVQVKPFSDRADTKSLQKNPFELTLDLLNKLKALEYFIFNRLAQQAIPQPIKCSCAIAFMVSCKRCDI